MLTQSGHIMVLIVAQLVILLLAAAALAWRQYRQEKERQALQRLTESLQAANAAAEEANKGKSQFLANMSHELRTPFNGVLGMLTLLERTRLDSSQREYVHTARHSADHLLSLLNDILDVSAMEAGKMSIHPVPVHLPPPAGRDREADATARPAKRLGLRHGINGRPALVGRSGWNAAPADFFESGHQRDQVQ